MPLGSAVLINSHDVRRARLAYHGEVVGVLCRLVAEELCMNKSRRFSILAMGSLMVCGIAASMLPRVGHAQADPSVAKAMADLKARTAKLGAPTLQGKEPVAGKDASALYFGKTRINNNFEVVDAVVKKYGGTATLFAKTGNEYVRVSTNVPLPQGRGRATGTILDPKGKAIVNINKGEPFYGVVTLLTAEVLSYGESPIVENVQEELYVTGYEPITDASGKVIGVYYVGYKQ
jgi:hypothetical protein